MNRSRLTCCRHFFDFDSKKVRKLSGSLFSAMDHEPEGSEYPTDEIYYLIRYPNEDYRVLVVHDTKTNWNQLFAHIQQRLNGVWPCIPKERFKVVSEKRLHPGRGLMLFSRYYDSWRSELAVTPIRKPQEMRKYTHYIARYVQPPYVHFHRARCHLCHAWLPSQDYNTNKCQHCQWV